MWVLGGGWVRGRASVGLAAFRVLRSSARAYVPGVSGECVARLGCACSARLGRRVRVLSECFTHRECMRSACITVECYARPAALESAAFVRLSSRILDFSTRLVPRLILRPSYTNSRSLDTASTPSPDTPPPSAASASSTPAPSPSPARATAPSACGTSSAARASASSRATPTPSARLTCAGTGR